MIAEFAPLILFFAVCVMLMAGFPVAFTLAGTALFGAAIGILTGTFDAQIMGAFPNRLFGTMTNTTLTAVPLFVLMGVLLERSKLAEDLLDAMASLFGKMPGGLSISVILVGALLAASTGIVGATVVTMGLMSLPTMLKRGYDPAIACGSICATGTLGQIIPPSIALVLLGDILSSSYQQTQLAQGNFTPDTISVGDLFVGALIPGLILVGMYISYIALVAWLKPHLVPPIEQLEKPTTKKLLQALVPPLILIAIVLGSILAGAATPTEAAGVGAVGAAILAFAKGQLDLKRAHEVAITTLEVTSMVFMILIGAAVFSLVFRGFGGEHLIADLFAQMPGGVIGATAVVMLVIFLLGFILDFIEITFVVVPIVAPILLAMGIDPLWLGIMIAVNLQTSFLTPPFGFALFYLRGVAPPEVQTLQIYKGVLPFIVLQIALLIILTVWPELITWLPSVVYK
ncbi:MAG: tripartite ATP-independent transporter DctM subunit [Pseudomonadales bacterium]|jgi:tripartite ATP-independent transporter DctM subunit